MQKRVNHAKIYKTIIDVLEGAPYSRKSLITKCIESLGLSREELADKSTDSKQNILRSQLGTVINEMHACGLISPGADAKYSLALAKPVSVRLEGCEREVIRALTDGAKTKNALRQEVLSALGADKTPSTRDDDKIFAYVGQILKRLLADGIVTSDGTFYSLSPKVVANADDVNAMLTLRSDFISKIHNRGGEFFENYFMSLLERYVKKHGKTVLECYVVGGSADGGIDGVLKTVDALGFRETVMVQTKNRTEMTVETDVRGFYGAVCAKQGSRGIYAITSHFHSGAQAFLDGLNDCIGINGERLFSMALECSYGIKKTANGLAVDEKII